MCWETTDEPRPGRETDRKRMNGRNEGEVHCEDENQGVACIHLSVRLFLD